MNSRRIFLYAVSVVSPGAQNLSEFLGLVKQKKTSLVPDENLYQAFLTGHPKFDWSHYKDWISSRHNASRFRQIEEKTGIKARMALGCCIDALQNNPPLESVLTQLDQKVLISIGSAFDDLTISSLATRQWDKAQYQWDFFWGANPQNPVFAHWQENSYPLPLPQPQEFLEDSSEKIEALKAWHHFWALQNPYLKEFIQECQEIENQSLLHSEDIARDKIQLLKQKSRGLKELQKKWNCPKPPWECVDANLVWNLQNAPAAQISMTLNIHGAHQSLNGACASFGVVVKNAMDAILSREFDAAIVGASEVPPTPELVSAFYDGRVSALGTSHNSPWGGMRGIHVSGGAFIWILGAEDTLLPLGVEHTGIEICGAGVSSDAEHIITPSKEGPKACIEKALQMANEPIIHSWDLHATATPGDENEMQLMSSYFQEETIVSARKGFFGHSMGVAGGWEMTAQLLAPEQKEDGFELPPCALENQKYHSFLEKYKVQFLLDKPLFCHTHKQPLVCGKINMGVGGVSACVIAKRYFKENS